MTPNTAMKGSHFRSKYMRLTARALSLYRLLPSASMLDFCAAPLRDGGGGERERERGREGEREREKKKEKEKEKERKE